MLRDRALRRCTLRNDDMHVSAREPRALLIRLRLDRCHAPLEAELPQDPLHPIEIASPEFNGIELNGRRAVLHGGRIVAKLCRPCFVQRVFRFGVAIDSIARVARNDQAAVSAPASHDRLLRQHNPLQMISGAGSF
jgi:hypothetical protein